MSSILLKATLALLDDTSREDWPVLAQKVGCTYSWLCQLDKAIIKEPGVKKIEALFVALGGKFEDLRHD